MKEVPEILYNSLHENLKIRVREEVDMPIAAITSKGQVTIPKKVRELFDLHTGDKIEFVFEKEGAVTVRPVKKTVDEVFGVLSGSARKPLSVEEMNDAIQLHMKKESCGQTDESA